MVKTAGELYLEIRRTLMTREDAQTASLIARNLICHVTGKTQEQVIAGRDLYIQESTYLEVSRLTARILAGEPLAYVLGQWEFYGLKLYVTPDVLIPRDDTCAVAELAIRQGMFLNRSPRILDLCTGSGCIGLAVASHIKDAKVTLGDISREALQVARKNITLHKLSARVSAVQANALEKPSSFLGKFDMIVSNPPYVTAKQMEELPDSVGKYEPHLALYGGDDGLDFYRTVTRNYKEILKPGGYLCYEFGMGQGDAVCDILIENGFTVLERTRDYNDRERAVLARYDRKEA